MGRREPSRKISEDKEIPHGSFVSSKHLPLSAALPSVNLRHGTRLKQDVGVWLHHLRPLLHVVKKRIWSGKYPS